MENFCQLIYFNWIDKKKKLEKFLEFNLNSHDMKAHRKTTHMKVYESDIR